MNSKFVRKLRREIKANPKKTGSLGLLCLVAVYFWAPLVMGWFGGDKPAKPATQPAAQQTVVAQTAAPPPKAAKASWHEVAASIESDVRMRPAALVVQRDPFKMPVVEVVEQKEAPVVAAVHVATPQEAGLVLSSTIVGGRVQQALVNGKAYRLGDTISASLKDGVTVEFVVVEIRAKQIVLESNGQRHQLELTPRGIGKDTFSSVRN